MSSSVKTGRSLRELKPVFTRWVSVNRKYVEYWAGKDCGWWYNERASIGFLAIAAWRPDEVALEEYSTKKGRKKDSYAGRCDLYFTNRNHDFVVEAKQVWMNLAHLKEGLDNVKANLDQACSEAMHVRDRVSRRIGVVFVVPKLRSPVKRVRRQRIGEWLKELDSIRFDALCWIMPNEAFKMKAGGHYYPGVALIARVVKKYQ